MQVNNAGMGRNNAGLFDGKTSSWVEMISTNVLGPCMCTREALQVPNTARFWHSSDPADSCHMLANMVQKLFQELARSQESGERTRVTAWNVVTGHEAARTVGSHN